MSGVAEVTPEALDTVEARANAATEGPWDAAHHYRPSKGETYENADWSTVGAEGKRIVATKEGWGTPQDAEFIAHAREDIPALMVELRRLRTENEEQGRKIAAALAVPLRDYHAGSSQAQMRTALTGEATA